ncbi:MAG: S-methyl-5-thioribose-1-phosphate isomerase [Anaerolineae bacterium]|nr:S-methyl-5-thioribose-1-phosphate isomerase [Anaerolineae bacterium]
MPERGDELTCIPKTVEWRDGAVLMIDQRRLPHELEIARFEDYRQVAEAIRDMCVRGAPAIGAAAAFGMALAAREAVGTGTDVRQALEDAARVLRGTRPTAVNLFWAIDRMLGAARALAGRSPQEVADGLVEEAQIIAAKDEEANRRLGRYGAQLLPDPATVITHCNAGALATVAYGTALGVIRAAHEMGKEVHVLVDETRPRLQGAHLTTWELMQEGIDCTLIADNAAGLFLLRGQVSAVIFGADRIAANGDVANKIGTYKLALAAHENGVPVYCAAPLSTVDMALPRGLDIPIEERSPDEVLYICGQRIAPEGVKVANPAFDITPARYITAIVTEAGVLRPPFEESLRRAVEETGR